jgi:2-keto-3-deoxy-6-phosphogluconate aldolase
VDVSKARALLEAGAFAIGVGGSIFSSEAMSVGDTHAVKRAAEDIVAEVRR